VSLDPVCGRRQAASTETIRSSSSCHLFAWDISNTAFGIAKQFVIADDEPFAERRSETGLVITQIISTEPTKS
jgi:hypothetical protein